MECINCHQNMKPNGYYKDHRYYKCRCGTKAMENNSIEVKWKLPSTIKPTQKQINFINRNSNLLVPLNIRKEELVTRWQYIWAIDSCVLLIRELQRHRR